MKHALFLLALILYLTGCAKQDAVTARVTVEFAYESLQQAYAYQSARVAVESCQDYSCNSVDQCAALTDCPAQKELVKAWDPIWDVHEGMVNAIELGDSDAARLGYCKLKAHAEVLGVPLPSPTYDCREILT